MPRLRLRQLRPLLVTVLILTGAVGGRAEDRPGAEDAIPYAVTFTGLDGAGDLGPRVRSASTLGTDMETPPRTRTGLRQRVEADIADFETVARSLGYYGAVFSADLESREDGFHVTVRADPGLRYTISEIVVDTEGHAIGGLTIPTRRLGVAVGDPAASEPVVAAEGNLIRYLQENGRPLARAGEREVLVDHRDRTMRIRYRVDPGPAARFGPVTIDGAERVDPTFVLRRLPWTFGEPADVRALEAGREALVASGVFSSATVRFGETVDGDGLIPVRVAVSERKPRSIGAGVSVSTAEGAAASVFWTHRNLFGGAERLELRGTVGQVETSARAGLRFPDVFFNDQDLTLSGSVVSEETDSYESSRYVTAAGFDRKLSRSVSVDYGVSLERSRIDEDGAERQFTLVGLPVGIRRDTSNDLLDPSEGARMRLAYTPYFEAIGSTVGFHVLTGQYARYVALDQDARFVLAGRAGLGSVFGAGTADVPADKRLYAGGSGSVRGYGLQAIGPLDAQDEAFGGRALVEFGLELRWRVTESIGLVPFVDAGQIYDDVVPSFDEELQWAAGLGARYHTPIGPVRVDLAFPLNARPSDDAFQVYFSLGQAF